MFIQLFFPVIQATGPQPLKNEQHQKQAVVTNYNSHLNPSKIYILIILTYIINYIN